MILRDYQNLIVGEARRAIHKRPVIVAPAGSGKTVVAGEIVRLATERGKRVLFLVHRRELVQQACDRFAAFGIESGVILARCREDRSLPVQVASVQTLIRRDKPEADLVIVDECHHATATTYEQILNSYPDAYLLGLTATPYRLDGKGLGRVFGSVVAPVTPRDLCDAGILVEPTVYSHPSGATAADGVHVRAGDYILRELSERMRRGKLIGNILEHYQRHGCEDRRTVVFAVDVEHSRDIQDRFLQAGVSCEHLDAKTPLVERAGILDRLAKGTTRVLTNCQIVSEGWDLPALEVAILARPTKSLCLHIQQVGRVMRSCPGKNGALVLDHAGNFQRHGSVLQEIDFSLDDVEKRNTTEEALTKQCPSCYLVVPLATETCPECGHVFTPEEDPTVEEPGDLVRFNERKKFTDDMKRSIYLGFIRTANERDYSVGWARYRYRDTVGKFPRGRWLREIENEHYTCTAHLWEEKSYGYRRIVRCKRCFREKDSVRDSATHW